MSGTSVLWFVFSAGGVVVALLVAAIWQWRRPGSRTARLYLGTVALGYTLASLYVVPHSVGHVLSAPFRPIAKTDIAAGQTIIVLLASGNHSRADWTDRSLSVLDAIGAERTLEAARVYHLAPSASIISSGGRLAPEAGADPTSVTMKTVLVQLGVPPERIVLESKSRTTREEAVLVADMIKSMEADQIILVTSALHMRRSIGVFRSVGLDPIPAIARDWTFSELSVRVLPTFTGLRESAYVAHEAVGIAYYWLRGWYQ